MNAILTLEPDRGTTALLMVVTILILLLAGARWLFVVPPVALGISALAAKVLGVHGATHPELTAIESTFEQLRAELEPHLAKEERVLFPAIRKLAAADRAEDRGMALTGPISQMLREHDQAGELLERLRRISTGYVVPSDGCASYEALYRALEALEADTHLHVHIENNRLFPMVAGLESDAGSDANRSEA